MKKVSCRIGAAIVFCGCSWGAERPVSSTEFAVRAFATLPVEEEYTFHKLLSQGGEKLRRDPKAVPQSGEMVIPDQGWSIVIGSGAGPVLRHAADDFADYMKTAMRTRIDVQAKDSLADWSSLRRTIIAGTREQMPGCGVGLSGPKDYELDANPERIVVCGYDERGAMYGLYNLEARMNLREAPFLPADLKALRHSKFQARMTHSGLGWEEWPDPYLSTLSHYGFDSIYASPYVNPNGVPGPPPHWDKMRKQDPAQVHDLIKRAARYGIDLYCPIIYLYTGEPENEAGLRKLVRDIVTEFPEIRGYILLTEGFFYRNWFGAGGGGGPEALKEWVRNWARGVEIVAEECRKLNPAIEVLAWEYNISFRPEAVEIKKYAVAQMPQDTIPLLTFENGKGFERDGQSSWLRDYSISEVGPAEVTAAQLEVARERRQRAVYSKADTWASWQFGTTPYLPFPYQWYARYEALDKYKIDGTLESWSYGFQPSWVGEMRAWYSWDNAPPLDELLRMIARREFGPGAEDRVLKAWDSFSAAIRLMPDTGPTWGTNNAVAAPIFFEQPVKPRIMSWLHAWTDQEIWSRESGCNPFWPYVRNNFFLYPDFTNKVNVAERYARPFTLPVFQKYLLLAADEMEKGLIHYRAAALKAPESKRKNAFREVLLAEQIQRMIRSENAVLEFEDLRFRLAGTATAAEKGRMLNRMVDVLKEEIARAELSYETARRDSRLGYEWEQDYVYTPDVIQEKLALLRDILTRQIPAYRETTVGSDLSNARRQ
jgi:hypothetical protein